MSFEIMSVEGGSAWTSSRAPSRAAARRTTSLVVADERTIRREALASWLRADPFLDVVSLASRAEEAAASVVDAQPGVLLLVCDLPTHPFIALASRIARLSDRTHVIVLSEGHSERSCRAAAVCGASAHVSMGDAPDELLASLRGRSGGQPSRCVTPAQEAVAGSALSNREREVLVHLAKGLSAKQTAATLGICAKTVDNHAQRLMRKLDLHSRADVVLFAVREGYVVP